MATGSEQSHPQAPGPPEEAFVEADQPSAEASSTDWSPQLSADASEREVVPAWSAPKPLWAKYEDVS